MLTEVVPEIHVLHAVAARKFYCGKLGFTCVDSWRPDNNKDDPCFMTLDRDDARLYVTSFKDGALGTSVYIFVDDVDALYAEFAGKGVPNLTPILDQTWGTREFGLADSDQNKLRFGQRRRIPAR